MFEPNEKTFSVGDRVRIVSLPPYVKTAEPMPMLRPPHVIRLGEEGIVLDRRPGRCWGVRFAKGAFLIDSQYIEAVSEEPSDTAIAGVTAIHASETGSISVHLTEDDQDP